MENENKDFEAVKQEKTDRFPCPSCGGNMVFSPEKQCLECPYCSNVIDITKQTGDIAEYDFYSKVDSANLNWGNEKRVIKCQSCGAETVLDENSTAELCPFCGSSYIVKSDNDAGIAPESLVPFKISQKDALNCFKNWIKKRHFAPNSLKKIYLPQKIVGMYIPCWTYDADTFSTYTAEAGEYYYVTETEWVEENGQRKMITKQVRKIRWWPTSGVYSEYFDDVLVNASRQVDEKLMNKFRSFNLTELVHYKPEFLSGFHAERYSVNLKEGWDIAINTVKAGIQSGIIQKINADEVRNLNVSTSYNQIKYKHILLPLWLSTYTYKNKVYRYMINGQTGEVKGHAPVSPWKIAGLVILGIIIIAIIIYLASKNQHA